MPSKEVDILVRTNQSIRPDTIPPDSIPHQTPTTTLNYPQTYRHKLTALTLLNGTNTHAFTQQLRPLYTNHLMDETTNPSEGITFVPITTEDKQRIYQRWANALIVKVYGKIVGYNFLNRKLHELWKRT